MIPFCSRVQTNTTMNESWETATLCCWCCCFLASTSRTNKTRFSLAEDRIHSSNSSNVHPNNKMDPHIQPHILRKYQSHTNSSLWNIFNFEIFNFQVSICLTKMKKNLLQRWCDNHQWQQFDVHDVVLETNFLFYNQEFVSNSSHLQEKKKKFAIDSKIKKCLICFNLVIEVTTNPNGK